MSVHPIPESALGAHLAILGKTGAGKSYVARSLVERILAARGRVCVVDPTGVYWGLRLTADGTRASPYPAVIAGGRHGDVPLGEGDGPALARIAGTRATPLILDTSALTVGARTRLFTAFAEELIVANAGPLHLVLDEAHLFAPQTRVPDPASARMVHAANGLVALGRARGLRIMLLTQRPAKLHKDCLTQVETLVAMRLVAPQDRKAVEAWIKDQADPKRGAEIVASLPALAQGEGWIWAPDAGLLERARFPAIATFDSMRPEAQGARSMPAIDLGAIKAALAAEVSEHGAEGTAAIKRHGRSKSSPGTLTTEDNAAAMAAAEQRGYERGRTEGYREAKDIEGRRVAHAQMVRVVDALVGAAMVVGDGDALIAALECMKTIKVGSMETADDAWNSAQVQPTSAPEDVANREQPRARPTPKKRTGDLNSAARKLLAVLDTKPPVRRSWSQVATLAGLKARGGHFNAGRKALLDQAWVVEEDGLVVIRQPSTSARPQTIDPDALVAMWAKSLSGAAPRILQHLHQAGPAPRKAIARDLDLMPRGGHWNAAWKQLRDNGLIVELGELVGLSELFFAQATDGETDG